MFVDTTKEEVSPIWIANENLHSQYNWQKSIFITNCCQNIGICRRIKSIDRSKSPVIMIFKLLSVVTDKPLIVPKRRTEESPIEITRSIIFVEKICYHMWIQSKNSRTRIKIYGISKGSCDINRPVIVRPNIISIICIIIQWQVQDWMTRVIAGSWIFCNIDVSLQEINILLLQIRDPYQWYRKKFLWDKYSHSDPMQHCFLSEITHQNSQDKTPNQVAELRKNDSSDKMRENNQLWINLFPDLLFIYYLN